MVIGSNSPARCCECEKRVARAKLQSRTNYIERFNQLERLQRTRKSEFVPAPESVDVLMHSERET